MYQCYDFFIEHWNFQYIEYVCFQSHLLDQICHFHWTLVATGRDDWLQIMADWLQIMAVLWRSARSRSRCLLQTKMMSWFHWLLVLVMLWITHELLKWPVPVATKVFFPNSNSFGVVRHSNGFGAELLSDSLWFSRADPWAARRFHGRFHQSSVKVSPRFQKGCTTVPPGSSSFVMSLVLWGRSVLGC